MHCLYGLSFLCAACHRRVRLLQRTVTAFSGKLGLGSCAWTAAVWTVIVSIVVAPAASLTIAVNLPADDPTTLSRCQSRFCNGDPSTALQCHADMYMDPGCTCQPCPSASAAAEPTQFERKRLLCLAWGKVCGNASSSTRPPAVTANATDYGSSTNSANSTTATEERQLALILGIIGLIVAAAIVGVGKFAYKHWRDQLQEQGVLSGSAASAHSSSQQEEASQQSFLQPKSHQPNSTTSARVNNEFTD